MAMERSSRLSSRFGTPPEYGQRVVFCQSLGEQAVDSAALRSHLAMTVTGFKLGNAPPVDI